MKYLRHAQDEMNEIVSPSYSLHCSSMLGAAHSPKCGRENIPQEFLQEFLPEFHPTPVTIQRWKHICPWTQNTLQETQYHHHKVQASSYMIGAILVTNYSHVVAANLRREERNAEGQDFWPWGCAKSLRSRLMSVTSVSFWRCFMLGA